MLRPPYFVTPVDPDGNPQSRSGAMAPKPRLNVHDFPRPPLLELTPRHLVLRWNGQTLADTKSAYWVLETTHPPSRSATELDLDA